jgi:Nucleotidyltransferase domain.
MWLVGSSHDGTAGPGSDVDLVVHTDDDPGRREALATWLEGWSLCLGEVNYLRTGLRTKGLLDVRFISDSDISRGTSWAAKVTGAKDPARPLPLHASVRTGPVPRKGRGAGKSEGGSR